MKTESIAYLNGIYDAVMSKLQDKDSAPEFDSVFSGVDLPELLVEKSPLFEQFRDSEYTRDLDADDILFHMDYDRDIIRGYIPQWYPHDNFILLKSVVIEEHCEEIPLSGIGFGMLYQITKLQDGDTRWDVIEIGKQNGFLRLYASVQVIWHYGISNETMEDIMAGWSPEIELQVSELIAQLKDYERLEGVGSDVQHTLLRESYDDITVCGMQYNELDIIRRMDSIAYNELHLNWIDSLDQKTVRRMDESLDELLDELEDLEYTYNLEIDYPEY